MIRASREYICALLFLISCHVVVCVCVCVCVGWKTSRAYNCFSTHPCTRFHVWEWEHNGNTELISCEWWSLRIFSVHPTWSNIFHLYKIGETQIVLSTYYFQKTGSTDSTPITSQRISDLKLFERSYIFHRPPLDLKHFMMFSIRPINWEYLPSCLAYEYHVTKCTFNA